MKIAWFTPFHVDSAIAEFSQHVTRELANLAEIEIWTMDDGPLLETELPVVVYKPGSADLKELTDRDVIVYNMGNYRAYHGGMLSVVEEYPGVVILHDRALQHLFADMWLGAKPEPERYMHRMGTFYGVEGREVARASLQGKRKPVWESDKDILRYPLYEESIVNALGVATHSKSHAQDVRTRWWGPVEALHLPCYKDVRERVGKRSPDLADGERLRLLTVGHINPNKQVHQVIAMLAARPDLAARVEYRVAGTDGGFAAYRKSLKDMIQEGPDELKVEIVGWLDNDELEREMQQAHVFVNLRYPNIEGGSASLMRQLAFGRPVLCFDSGAFGDLPEGTVARVPVADFAAAAATVEELATSVERRQRLGARARAVASEYDERRYAEGLLKLLEESKSAGPALRCVDSVGRELGRMRVCADLPIFDEIAKDFGRVLNFRGGS